MPRRVSRETVHPRACGEHSSGPISGVSANGSSPRLRGTRLEHAVCANFVRFIPAPAGNTTAAAEPCPALPVHPRACGEHQTYAPAATGSYGSSPRLRGTLESSLLVVSSIRFIPAPAGNTVRFRFFPTSKSVHPRACGEHARSKGHLDRLIGSSPRLRGTHN